MPFTEHLRELRSRLFICDCQRRRHRRPALLALAVRDPLDDRRPTSTASRSTRSVRPTSIFTEFKFSLIGGIVLGLPVLFYQAWMFVVPAIHPKTRRMVYSFIVPSLLLAAAGIAFAHFVVIPRVVAALIGITDADRDADLRRRGHDQFRDDLTCALRADLSDSRSCWSALRASGIVNAAWLGKYRRHALFAMVVAGGIAAPDGNPMTMALLAVPMYMLVRGLDLDHSYLLNERGQRELSTYYARFRCARSANVLFAVASSSCGASSR